MKLLANLQGQPKRRAQKLFKAPEQQIKDTQFSGKHPKNSHTRVHNHGHIYTKST